jgi:ATP-dependent Clp protease ATP-binding subunit ClpC
MFLGPTGVGKTELARSLAEFMFNDEKALVRIDMSEYMEKHAVARLIGSPPGYVGFEEGGQLTEAVRHRPYSLILFDEIEKAHPEVFNILLQILDNGRLTDAKGKVVNFKNSIIIMTSNVGSHYFRELSQLGFAAPSDGTGRSSSEEASREKVQETLRQSFKPEFLNRIDDVIVFNALTRTDIEEIVELQLKDLKRRLEARGMKVTIDVGAKRYIVEHGFDPDFGARPIARLIQKTILNQLADKIIKGQIKNGDRVKVTLADAAINVTA